MKISQKLDNIFGLDKILHFSISLNLMLLISLASHELYGVLATLLLDILKEMIDSLDENNKFSYGDMTANILGILFGILFLKSI
jgi:hypothetical protein